MTMTHSSSTMPASTRAHLVRSTRKLAHILGTTPTASDCSDTESIRSVRSLRKKPSTLTPATLLVSIPPSNLEFELDPLSPSPISPTSPNYDEQAEKRRKLAKLRRTLGDNVPPELVFGMPPTQQVKAPAAHHHQHRRGASLAQVTYSRNVQSTRISLALTQKNKDAPFCPPSPISSSSSDDEEEYTYSMHSCVREEPSWEGKWNRMSMGEVRARLRQLK